MTFLHFLPLSFLLVILIATACSPSDPRHLPEEDTGGPEDVPAHVMKIRIERAKLKPGETSLLVKITEQYNLLQKPHDDHRPWARRCVQYRDLFEQAERLTLYPAAFIGAFAAAESGGCRMDASDWAGGKGFMQITAAPSKRELRDIASLLGIEVADVDYRHDPLHNIITGLVRLDTYERSLGSRFHGIQAYNMGPGCPTDSCAKPKLGVRGAARNAGWKKGRPLPEIVTLKPHLAYNKRMKPRVYVQRVLAFSVMMNQALRGEPITRAERIFTPDNIPGWDPADDGARFLTAQ